MRKSFFVLTCCFVLGKTPFLFAQQDSAVKATLPLLEFLFSERDTALLWKAEEKETVTYFIQQYRWGKWVQIGAQLSKDGLGIHEYSFKPNVHSGQNQFRISTGDRISRPLLVNGYEEIRDISGRVCNWGFYRFNRETLYEIWDESGHLVKSGRAKEVDLSQGLPKGIFYFNYDNKTTEFINNRAR